MLQDQWTSTRAPSNRRGDEASTQDRENGVSNIGILPRDPPWLMRISDEARKLYKIPIHIIFFVLHWAILLEGARRRLQKTLAKKTKRSRWRLDPDTEVPRFS